MSQYKFVDVPCQKADPDTFFPDPTEFDKIALAKSYCDRCIQVSDCLAYALDTESRFGIFGGTTQVERARIKRRNDRLGLK